MMKFNEETKIISFPLNDINGKKIFFNNNRIEEKYKYFDENMFKYVRTICSHLIIKFCNKKLEK